MGLTNDELHTFLYWKVDFVFDRQTDGAEDDRKPKLPSNFKFRV